jgi:hypothetical protein
MKKTPSPALPRYAGEGAPRPAAIFHEPSPTNHGRVGPAPSPAKRGRVGEGA